MNDSEKKKTLQLLKEIRNEKSIENTKSTSEENRLDWMYKGPTDLIEREEYLLGKSIDKSFEIMNNGGNLDAHLATSYEQSNIPRRLLEKTDNTEQVDIAKKILEDPLYAIKQKELEARKKLLHNPVKLKQLKQMLLERNLNNENKKKLGQFDIEELDFKIMQKLKKLNEKLKKKAFKKILNLNSNSSSEKDPEEKNKKNHIILKKLKKRKEEDNLEGSIKRKKNKKNKKNKIRDIEKKKKHDNQYDFKIEKEYGKTKKVQEKSVSQQKCNKKYNKVSKDKSDLSSTSSTNSNISSNDISSDDISSDLSDSSSNTLSDNSNNNSSDTSGSGKLNKLEKSKYHYSKNLRRAHSPDIITEADKNKHFKRNGKKKTNVSKKINHTSDSDNSTNSTEYNKKEKKKYGLLVSKSSKSFSRKFAPVKKYEKYTKTKTKYVPASKPKALSEKEKEKKLKEMMENAKLRKIDREKNLERHRKIQVQEEENKTYDADFLRRQTSYFTSQGTMADRIKSNANNIQRSHLLMDKSFLRK